MPLELRSGQHLQVCSFVRHCLLNCVTDADATASNAASGVLREAGAASASATGVTVDCVNLELTDDAVEMRSRGRSSVVLERSGLLIQLLIAVPIWHIHA